MLHFNAHPTSTMFGLSKLNFSQVMFIRGKNRVSKSFLIYKVVKGSRCSRGSVRNFKLWVQFLVICSYSTVLQTWVQIPCIKRTFLRICGCNCTHCTCTNITPVQCRVPSVQYQHQVHCPNQLKNNCNILPVRCLFQSFIRHVYKSFRAASLYTLL